MACEFSGRVRDAFIARGHDAWSCDLLPSESDRGPHYQGDVRKLIAPGARWDLMIAHPPCTYLAASGNRWIDRPDRRRQQAEAIRFVALLLSSSVPMIALENPIGVLSTRIRRPDQIVQPWWFGHAETKATCLWLKGLPRLRATRVVLSAPLDNRVHRMAPGPDRWKLRSLTYQGIADAMASQWG